MADRTGSSDPAERLQTSWPAWLTGLRPFRSVVWPGTGPRLNIARDWPELAFIALAVLLFWRGAAAADAPNVVAAAQRAILHPVFGLPAVLLGVAGGVRFALLVGLLAAASGIWWLGVVLGLGRLGRVWVSLAYTFAGGVGAGWLAGRFGLELGYPWLPWALAYALLAVRWRRRLYAAGAAAALALILVGGDLGLTCATFTVLAIFLVVAGISLRRERPRIVLRRDEALIAALIGLLGFGLAAVQVLPQLVSAFAGAELVRSAGTGAGLGRLLGALTIGPEGPPIAGGLYAYLGVAPFLFLTGLPLAMRRANRRVMLGLGLLVALTLLWAASDWLSRTGASAALLAWGAVTLLALAGLGLDALWRWAAANLKLRRMNLPAAVRWAVAWLAIIALAVIAAVSVIDLYLKNRPGPAAAFTILSGLNAGDLLRAFAGQHPVWLGVGTAMSVLSLIGFLALIVGDVRSRRSRIETGAVYADGVLRPAEPLDLPDGTSVRVTVEAEGVASAPASAATPTVDTSAPVVAAAPEQAAVAVTGTAPETGSAARLAILAWVLFGLGLALYAFTRLWHIDKFPIYFFTDEAANPLFAQDLIDHGFRNAQGKLFPLYFELAANRWGPLLSVYVHAFSSALFGKTVVVTRATQAIVSLLAPISVALSLKLAFKARFWWIGVLLMTLAPAWFLHSRTGFETIIAASFYGCFILFYLLYRTRSPRYLYAALLFGVATFYTYSNGQMIMAVAGVLLALTDIRYHLKNWRTIWPVVLLLLVCMVPALRFRAEQPNALTTHLRVLDSYWFYDKPLSQKVAQFIKTYAYGMSPAYWFIPNETDLVRHRMLGYGNINVWLLPLFLIGVGLSLWRTVKGSVPHRILLLVTIATPAGAALAHVALTRVMAFVVPATLLSALGIEYLLSFARRRVSERILAPALFVVLMIPSLLMLRDALSNGPTWYRDYGLYGMQYGATQLFGDEIPQYLVEHPESEVIISPTWANGTDNFIRFFLSPEQQRRVQMLNVDYFMGTRRDLNPNMVFVMPAYEYERARTSDRFKQVDVERMLPYPDGTPGFYFVRLAYADDLEAILAREHEERSRPVTEQIELDGQLVQVSHSIFDGGQLSDLFDGDPFTLARGLEANPLVIELTFPEPRAMHGLEGVFGSMDFALTAKLYADGNPEPKVYSESYTGLPPDPRVEMAFPDAPAAVKKVRLEILQHNAPQDVHVHVRELKFQ